MISEQIKDTTLVLLDIRLQRQSYRNRNAWNEASSLRINASTVFFFFISSIKNDQKIF